MAHSLKKYEVVYRVGMQPTELRDNVMASSPEHATACIKGTSKLQVFIVSVKEQASEAPKAPQAFPVGTLITIQTAVKFIGGTRCKQWSKARIVSNDGLHCEYKITEVIEYDSPEPLVSVGDKGGFVLRYAHMVPGLAIISE